MKDIPHIGVFGLNHNTAPVEIRERLYVPEAAVPEFLSRLKGQGVEEAGRGVDNGRRG